MEDRRRCVWRDRGRTRNDDNPDFPAETWLNGAASLAGASANILTPQAFSNKFDRRTPYVMQWLVNVQRELASNLPFEAGSRGIQPGLFDAQELSAPEGGSRPAIPLGSVQCPESSGMEATQRQSQQR